MDKICIFCKFWHFTSGERDWSDVTPGWNASTGCNKGYWDIDLYSTSTEEYRANLLKAGTCPDFSPIPEFKEAQP